MAQGRRPIGNAVKRARGETRPHKMQTAEVLDFPVVHKIPDPPEWVNSAGCDLWNDMAPALFRQRVLTHADLYALGHLCQLHGEIVDGYQRRIQPTAAQLGQMRMYFSEFGMTPSSRTKIGKAGDGDKGNAFKKNKAPADRP